MWLLHADFITSLLQFFFLNIFEDQLNFAVSSGYISMIFYCKNKFLKISATQLKWFKRCVRIFLVAAQSCKVQIFWKGHKNFAPSSTLFLTLLSIASNHNWKMGQIFVAFSKYLNFTFVQIPGLWLTNYFYSPFCLFSLHFSLWLGCIE